MHPADPAIDAAFAIRERMRDRGNVRVGRELRELLTAAGFERVEAAVVGQGDGTAEAAGRLAVFEAGWFAAPEVVAAAVERGVATADEMAACAEAWTRWGGHPGAFAARFWVTALAWAPW